jgi:hypothetical protein
MASAISDSIQADVGLLLKMGGKNIFFIKKIKNITSYVKNG